MSIRVLSTYGALISICAFGDGSISSSAAHFTVGGRTGFSMVGQPLRESVTTRTGATAYDGQIYVLFGFPKDSGADTDDDGLPDWWEDLRGFGKLDTNDPLMVPDAKGLTPLQHFVAGTDPNNPTSFPSILTNRDEITGVVKLSFLGVRGRRYTIQKTLSLVPGEVSWVSVGSPHVGDDEVLEIDYDLEDHEIIVYFKITIERITE
jgi:hypothetical protein